MRRSQLAFNCDDQDGLTWFAVHPALRGVAAELLGPRRADAVQHRVRADTEMLLDASDQVRSGRSRRWFTVLDRYDATLSGTLDELRAEQHPCQAAILVGLGPYRLDRGRFDEGRDG